MGELIPGVNEPQGVLLGAASACCAAACDMVEAARGTMTAGTNLRHREVIENLADAIQSVCSIELAAPDLDDDRREGVAGLLAAASRFIEGWA